MTDILGMTIPMLVWLALFSAMYGLHGVGCAGRWPGIFVGGASLFRVVVTTAFLSALLTQAVLLVAMRSSRLRSASPFIARVSIILAVAALASAAWALFPTQVLSACR